MKREFTSVIEKRGKWYVAYVDEIPGVNSQGRTLAEARRNLKEALTLALEANRAPIRERSLAGRKTRTHHRYRVSP
jgi:predicted RNase H-like HicB family nuclease